MRNAKELYDTLISMPDLHSIPELHDDILIWPLYKDAYICACCNSSAYIEIVSNSLYAGTLVHWKLSQDKMLERLYVLGKKVIFWFSRKPCLEQMCSTRGLRMNTRNLAKTVFILATKSMTADSLFAWSRNNCKKCLPVGEAFLDERCSPLRLRYDKDFSPAIMVVGAAIGRP